MDIAGKVAIVTGAGYGIGRGIAKRLGAAGVLVVVDDIDEVLGRETVKLVEAEGGRAAFVRADVLVEDAIRRMIAFAEETFGGLNILVNNAGLALDPPYFPEAGSDAWGRTLDVYLRAVMVCCQKGIQTMQRRGGGVIVNVSSMAGIGFQAYDWPEYAAAKAGVVRLTAALGELKERMNIRVNCICPGWVATEKVRANLAGWPDERKKAAHVPEPMLTPDDIGEEVLQFVQNDSLAGRVMLYIRPGESRLVPVDLEF